MKYFRIIASAAIAATLAACSGSSSDKASWNVSGTVEGGEGSSLMLQRYTGGRWVTIDSTSIGANGSFSLSHARMDYPDFYRLALDGNMLYFPIDTTESVTVNAVASDFSKGSIGGSRSAELMQLADAIINSATDSLGAEGALNSIELKRRLYDEVIMSAPGELSGFYVITRMIDGRPIFDAEKKFDFNIIRAVANFFNQYRPTDPRTESLRRIVAPSGSIAAEEISYPEISLMGLDGKPRNLSDLVGHGKPVVVCFSANTLEASPIINQTLAFAYRNGLADVYQVSLDPNEVAWREVASNLPWTSVYNTSADGDRYLRLYNVGDLPTLFIIDRNGQLTERVTDLSQLEKLLKKY